MATYLDRILDAHRRTAAADRRDMDDLVATACVNEPARGFAAALRAAPGLGVIAEIKRHSPSPWPPTLIRPTWLPPTNAVGPPVCRC
jgi:indole-3-glycerol phosphate synthase